MILYKGTHVNPDTVMTWLSGISGLDYWTGIVEWPKLL